MPEKEIKVLTAVPDDNDIEAIFTWRGHRHSFVDFLFGNVWQLHLDSDFLRRFLLHLFNKQANQVLLYYICASPNLQNILG